MGGMRGRKRVSLCLVALVSGMMPILNATGAYVDCKLCHLDPDPNSAAQDYLEYYSSPNREHIISVAYPSSPKADYNRPTGQEAGIRFFDTNGNGIADMNEIQLFGTAVQVECSSCHVEHGDGSPPPAQPNMYLRMTNAGSALCNVCHKL